MTLPLYGPIFDYSHYIQTDPNYHILRNGGQFRAIRMTLRQTRKASRFLDTYIHFEARVGNCCQWVTQRLLQKWSILVFDQAHPLLWCGVHFFAVFSSCAARRWPMRLVHIISSQVGHAKFHCTPNKLRVIYRTLESSYVEVQKLCLRNYIANLVKPIAHTYCALYFIIIRYKLSMISLLLRIWRSSIGC